MLEQALRKHNVAEPYSIKVLDKATVSKKKQNSLENYTGNVFKIILFTNMMVRNPIKKKLLKMVHS